MSLNSVNTNMGAMIALAVARPDELGSWLPLRSRSPPAIAWLTPRMTALPMPSHSPCVPLLAH